MNVLDRVWVLAKEGCVIYYMGASARDVWNKVMDDEVMGTGVTKEDLKRQGYRAVQVALVEE